MHTFTTRLGRWAAAGCVAGATALAAAQEGGTGRLTEKDYGSYAQLRVAREVASQKNMFAHTPDAKAAVAAQFAKACADAGWTTERFGEVDEAVGGALSALGDPESYSTDDIDKVTLATVKAHRKDLDNFAAVQKRAGEIVQEERLYAKRGAPATAAELAGAWVLDIPLSVALMTEGLPDEIKQSASAEYRKNLTGATYTFGPGDKFVASNLRPNAPPQTEEGRYRLDGPKLTIVTPRPGRADREMNLDAGIKDGQLRIGMMGGYCVFLKK